MNRPSVTSIAVGTGGGIASAIAVGALFSLFDYHVVMSATEWWTLLPGAFVLGFVTVALSVHTGLVSPGGGFLALLVAVVYTELTTSPPRAVVERGDDVIVDGSFHALSYAETWYVWLALLLVAGVAEFAIRRGYSLEDGRLRNLPTLPLSRTDLWLVVVGCSGAVGLATMILLVRGVLWETASGYGIGFVAAAVATVVPLAALLSYGIVSPFVLYGWLVMATLHTEAFTAPDSGLHIPILGVSSIGFVIVAGLELLVRSRLRGWDGGRFASAVSQE
ncbi:hypothetical protein [Natrinema sp. SYSU A 869]|uniref:hypothetical protein n=1 Tax=Natrinema sp. SYSU A 869 TaxID=2871694 RepID=UPI001CA3C747|nr:hypothetical protein [Natrinema sp. SYSU A 869]